MKINRIVRLILLIGVSANLFSTKLNGQNLNASRLNIKNLALTGQVETVVKQRIYDFAIHKGEDNRPEVASIWFDKETIRRMVALLDTENGDGIRIYYAADVADNPFLKASVILVSTKYDSVIHYADQSHHRDYYEHDSTNMLFKTSPDLLKGQLRNDDCDGGAKLYNRSDNTRALCDASNPNAVSISAAENMVIRNKNHKHEINTYSEWLPRGVFRAYSTDVKSDGVRVYFARRNGFLGVFTTGRNSFLLINTKADSTNNKIHLDDLDCNTSMVYLNYDIHFNKETHDYLPKLWKAYGDPTDNGELCPTHCP